jgi:hypothetical protein
MASLMSVRLAKLEYYLANLLRHKTETAFDAQHTTSCKPFIHAHVIGEGVVRLFNRKIVRIAVPALTLALAFLALPSAAPAGDGLVRIASGGPQPPRADASGKDSEQEPTLDQKFQRRFPQPVRVGDLIGLPVLDFDDSTIGYVSEVVRRGDGEIDLIVPYGPWFGWLRSQWGRRPVAVPIKSVALLAKQIDALEFTRDDFADAPTWTPSDGSPVALHEKTLIALGRR